MAQRRKRFMEETVSMRASFLWRPVLRITYGAFGRTYLGYNTESEYSITKNLEVNKTRYRRLHFSRTKPYSSNFLFNLTEFLCKVTRAIVRVSTYLAVIFFLILAVSKNGGAGDDVVIGLLITYAVLFVSMFVLSFLGKLWRSIYKLDDKLNEELEANGYETV